MATSLISSFFQSAPYFYDPVKSPLWTRVSSSGYNTPGFRYLIDIYTFGTVSTGFTNTASKIARVVVPPQPGNGNGIFSPNRILQEQIVSSVNPAIKNIAYVNKAACKYKLQVGNGYDPEWIGTYMRRGAPIAPADWASAKKPAGVTYSSSTTYYYAEIYSNTQRNYLTMGEINITLDNPFMLPYMQGKHQVTGVGYSTSIFFPNLLRLNTIYSSDNWGKDVLPSSATASIPFISIVDDYIYMQGYTEDLVTYNAVKPQEDLKRIYINTEQYTPLDSYTYSTPTATNASSFLSKWDHANNWKKIYPDQLETIDFLFYGTYEINEYKIKFYDQRMAELGTRYISFNPAYELSDKTWHYYSVQTGYYKVISQAVGGTPSFPTAKYYTVQLGRGNAGPTNQHGIAAKYQIVDRQCNDFNVRLCWLNSKGGYDYFNFEQLGERKVNVSRTEWTKQQPWNATISDRSHSVFNTSAQETYTAVTDYLNDYEYNFLEDLIYSDDVYIVKEDGTLIPIVVTDTEFSEMNIYRDSMKIMTINYKANTKLIS